MVKKVGLMLVLAAFAAGGVFGFDAKAYPDAVKKGGVSVHAGIGFGATPLYGDQKIPPIIGMVEWAFANPFTLGAYAGFMTSEYKVPVLNYSYSLNFTGMLFAGRFGWHPNLGVKNLDTYLSLALGYYIFKGEVSYNNWPDGYPKPPVTSDYSQFFYYGNIGARYYFAKNIGAFIELGYSAFSLASAGLSFKF